MATIRVRDWTKKKINEIRDAESHSSHDSVIKSLLKDRELAKFAGDSAEPTASVTSTDRDRPADRAIDEMAVVDELSVPDNGVLFLWCPNCAMEIAHMNVDGEMNVSVLEMDCPHCLSNLDQHAIVSIDIGYPLERKLVEDGLQADMKACVVDYWDRTLRNRAEDATDEGGGIEQLVWQFGQYTREFAWEWPTDVPAVGFEAGSTYRNTMTDEYIDVVEPVTGNRNALNSFEVKRYDSDTDPAAVEPEIMDSSTIVDLIVTRSLVVEVRSAPSIERHDNGSGQPT
ncbi:hypothetical protein [Halorientalis sp.]|uniref:hypothetical protein n=1 Tax=Halorientalis sp. TaxID=1931229 RepID=UPI002621F928|nr:hypothetical protein [Halorientalis sp.]